MDSLKKQSHVKLQEQMIEHLRRELHDLRLEMDAERTRQKEIMSQRERELKTAQTEARELAKTQSHLEVRAEVCEREAREAQSALQEARKAAKLAEDGAARTAKDGAWRCNQLEERISRLENDKQMAKDELEQLKAVLEIERSAGAALVREHAAELKNMRAELRTKLFEANKELQDRSMRDFEENRAVRDEAEKVQKMMEHDFRAVLLEKEEELRQARADAKATQKALEDQIRDSIKSSMTRSLVHTNSETDLVRSLRHELDTVKLRNKKLEKNLQAAGDAVMEATNKERSRNDDLSMERERQVRSEFRQVHPVQTRRNITKQEELRRMMAVFRRTLLP